MRRRTFFNSISSPVGIWTAVDKSETTAGDLYAYNHTTNEKIFLRLGGEEIYNITPIGVVIIPPSHDVYGNGEGCIMSIVSMRYDTPEIGGASQSLYWGSYNTTIGDLINYSVINIIGYASAQTTAISTYNYGYLPSDAFGAQICEKDNNTYYYTYSYRAAPSPFLTDDSRNEQYYSTTSSSLNALSNFDGKNQTTAILNYATSQTTWKTDTTITNSRDKGYYPAACCCWKYHTQGTTQGEWYLPSCGEIGYACARKKTINNTLQALIDYNLTDNCYLLGSETLWTTDEQSNNFVRTLNMGDGYLYYNYTKNYQNCARACMRI